MSWYRDEYLKSEDWKNLRLAILIYQDYICECCGGAAADVHHLVYRNIWDVIPLDLMATCRLCHNAIHDFMGSSKSFKYIEKCSKNGIISRINIDSRRPPKRGDKTGLLIRMMIAKYVSKRGYVEFKAHLSGKLLRKRMKVFSPEKSFGVNHFKRKA